MTLNDLERRKSTYFAFSPNSVALLAKDITVVEYRPIMSVNIVSQFQSSTFGHNSPTLQRDLSAIAELLVVSIYRPITHIKALITATVAGCCNETLAYGPRSFAVSGSTVWNTLPSTLRVSTTTIGQFQSGQYCFVWPMGHD